MTRCHPDQAELVLDGVCYRFESALEVDRTLATLSGLKGARFTRRCTARWGVPPLPAPVVCPPVKRRSGRREVVTVRLPDD